MTASYGRYDQGDLVRLIATFVSTDLITTADPSTVDLLVLSPTSGVACYRYLVAGASIIRGATGVYFKDLTLDAHGAWYYRFIGTGGIQAAEEWRLLVDASFIL